MQTEYICLYSYVHGLACMRRSEGLLQKQAFLFHNGGPEDHIQGIQTWKNTLLPSEPFRWHSSQSLMNMRDT